jgi:hypothetical protein
MHGPPVSCQISQLSTVPKASSPIGGWRGRRARCPDPFQLGAGEIGVHQQAGFGADGVGQAPLAQFGAGGFGAAVLPDDGVVWMGWPVRRFHTTVVSRWLVMPSACT